MDLAGQGGRFLLEYLPVFPAPALPIAVEHGGTVDKFIGDAIVAFFGDPVSNGPEEDARAAVAMALAMQARLVELRRDWRNKGLDDTFELRVGITTGYCTVGNFGSEDRMDYTIVGGAVNLASRLESAADADGILISSDTFSLVKDEVVCKPEREITVKGIAYPVKTYSVVDLIETLQKEKEHIEARLKGFNHVLHCSASSLSNTCKPCKAALVKGKS